MRPTEITGDGSVEDFCKWIRNFGNNDSGHFVDAKVCGEFSVLVSSFISTNLGGMVDDSNFIKFMEWLALKEHLFVDDGACMHFINQVVGYMDVDGHIGTKKA